MKILVGILLLLIGLPIIWLFPALTTPRESFGKDLPPAQYFQVQLQKHKHTHFLNLGVCIPAGVITGIGATLLLQGITRKKQETQHQGAR